MPIALTVLALFMVLELYNFTQTIAMNGGSTAFTIQQVALVMLKITLCRWAVLHSTEILNAMFEVAATVTNGIAGYVGSGQVNTEVDIENAISALPGGIGNMPVAMELIFEHSNHLRCQAMQDFDIYQATGRLEREANFFAADLLLDDAEVLDLIHSGNTDFFSVAKELCIPASFFAFKMYSLIRRGEHLQLPVDIDNRFLRAKH